MKKAKNFLIFRLSDKILVIIFIFSTLLFFLAKFIFSGSLVKTLVLGTAIYSLGFIFTYLISRNFSKRILSLTMKVEEMAAGNLSKKLVDNGRDEIGQLANALDGLVLRLKTGVAQDVSTHLELRQAKTDFVTLASHQLRTPLSIIKWYVDFLVSGDAGEINTEQTKYLKEVYVSNERLIELVNALLDVSRIDVGTFSIDPEPTDVIERAETALEKFLPMIEEKNIKLIKKYDEFPKINLDPRLTKIVFENLISNAVKYTKQNGIVKIVIKKTSKDIYVKISDSGCGIPREEHPKIFKKLFRGDSAKKIEAVGTGLGLYIVQAVIKKSGGKIWFESPSLDLFLKNELKEKNTPVSKIDKGTTFHFTIPLKGMKPKHGSKKLTSIK